VPSDRHAALPPDGKPAARAKSGFRTSRKSWRRSYRGRYQQKGAGAYTLCESCNSDTGSWYGTAYADWAAQAMRILIGTRARPTLEYPFRLSPLRVLKQIVCMFFSLNQALFYTKHPDLIRLVLNKELKDLPDHIYIYAFYTLSDRSRTAPITGVFKGSGPIHIFSEVTHFLHSVS
jgi:hypothetical protein